MNKDNMVFSQTQAPDCNYFEDPVALIIPLVYDAVGTSSQALTLGWTTSEPLCSISCQIKNKGC